MSVTIQQIRSGAREPETAPDSAPMTEGSHASPVADLADDIFIPDLAPDRAPPVSFYYMRTRKLWDSNPFARRYLLAMDTAIKKRENRDKFWHWFEYVGRSDLRNEWKIWKDTTNLKYIERFVGLLGDDAPGFLDQYIGSYLIKLFHDPRRRDDFLKLAQDAGPLASLMLGRLFLNEKLKKDFDEGGYPAIEGYWRDLKKLIMTVRKEYSVPLRWDKYWKKDAAERTEKARSDFMFFSFRQIEEEFGDPRLRPELEKLVAAAKDLTPQLIPAFLLVKKDFRKDGYDAIRPYWEGLVDIMQEDSGGMEYRGSFFEAFLDASKRPYLARIAKHAYGYFEIVDTAKDDIKTGGERLETITRLVESLERWKAHELFENEYGNGSIYNNIKKDLFSSSKVADGIISLAEDASDCPKEMFHSAYPRIRDDLIKGGVDAVKAYWRTVRKLITVYSETDQIRNRLFKETAITGFMDKALPKLDRYLNDPRYRDEVIDAIRSVKTKNVDIIELLEVFERFGEEFQKDGFGGEFKIIWDSALHAKGDIKLLLAAMEVGKKASLGLEWAGNMLKALSEKKDISAHFAAPIRNAKKMTLAARTALLRLIKSLPDNAIDASPGLVTEFGGLLKDAGGTPLGYDVAEMLVFWARTLRRSKEIIVKTMMEAAEEAGSKEASRFLWKNLAHFSNDLDDKIAAARIKEKIKTLFTKASPPWEEWLDRKINPEQNINVRLYVGFAKETQRYFLNLSGFKERSKDIFSKMVTLKDGRKVTVNVEMKDAEPSGAGGKVDIFKDLADPKLHFIVYCGHAGLGRNLEMYDERDENMPLEYGSKVIFVGACFSMGSYFARVQKVAPNSQFVGNVEKPRIENFILNLSAMASGVGKDWREIREDFEALRERVAPVVKKSWKKWPDVYLVFLATTYLYPDQPEQWEHYGVINRFNVRGNDDFEFVPTGLSKAELDGTRGGKVMQAVAAAAAAISWHGLNHLRFVTRNGGYDGEYFLSETDQREPLHIYRDYQEERDAYHVSVNAGYADLSQKALTVMIIWEFNKRFKDQAETKERNLLRGLKAVADFLSYHEPHDVLWQKLKERYDVPAAIEFKDVKGLISLEEDNKLNEAGLLREELLKKLTSDTVIKK